MTNSLTPLVVIGAGGFGREVLQLVRDINSARPTFDLIGLLDDGDVNVPLLARLGVPHLGPSSHLAEVDATYVVAIAAAEPRRRIDRLARSLGRQAAILVHPQASVGRDVVLGEGAIVAAGARLTTNIVVGRHAHINLNCTVGHDSVVEDFATLFGGVHVGGGCVICEGSMLGSGCVILPNVRVDRGAVVGAGAVVVRDVAPDVTVVGTVARPTLRSSASLDATIPEAPEPPKPPTTSLLGPWNARFLDVTSPRWAEILTEAPHDFYHLPEYVALSADQEQGEARALCVEDGAGSLLLPLIIRPIPGTGRLDATSPYGYPGPLATGATDATFLSRALQSSVGLLRSEGIVSLFVRFHPILNERIPEDFGEVVCHGHTVSIDLLLPATTIWAQTRHGHRQDIKKAMASGLTARIDLTFERYPEFKRLYRATMERRAAASYYFFGDSYLDRLREVLGERLHLCVVEEGDTVAGAALFVETGGIVQYHLACTDEAYTRSGSSKLALHHVVGWAKERGNCCLHLGGGVGGADDPLFGFKSGFSPKRHVFQTLRVVIDEEAYRRLTALRDPSVYPDVLGGYFPAYRAD